MSFLRAVATAMPHCFSCRTRKRSGEGGDLSCTSLLKQPLHTLSLCLSLSPIHCLHPAYSLCLSLCLCFYRVLLVLVIAVFLAAGVVAAHTRSLIVVVVVVVVVIITVITVCCVWMGGQDESLARALVAAQHATCPAVRSPVRDVEKSV